ncbi:aldolase, partial [candidate division KSB3 bacterium]|nr:aldolase [candidate division KSB3 bacterium]MBD3326731.1 aldolase [candidate division KSB3 bacterium]
VHADMKENPMQTKFENLIAMSRALGLDTNDYAILGEGNTSVKLDQDTFYVKASGAQLATISERGFVKVRFAPVLDALNRDALTDAEVKELLMQATLENPDGKTPSVETFLHAIILSCEGVNYVGHTHPTAINSILCSKYAEEAYSGRLFPDEIVMLGTDPLFIPYTDPGFVLAKFVQQKFTAYLDRFGIPPKAIYMQNHGFIALGKTDKDVLNITQMAVKTARILQGTYLMGGPRFFSDAEVNRIETRPDEQYRRKII